MQLKIIPIASGSSGNSMFMEFSGNRILIDMGVRLKRINSALNINNFSIEDINAVFITHCHNDHVSGFKVCSKHIITDYYSSKTVRDRLANRMVRGLEYDTRYRLNENLYVTAFKTSHDSPGSCGYIFENKNIRIGYATDLGMVDESILNHLKGSDVVIIESNHDLDMLYNGPYPYVLKRRIASISGHLSNADCAKTCRYLFENGTKHFILAHLSKENNTLDIAASETEKLIDADVRVLHPKSDEVIVYDI